MFKRRLFNVLIALTLVITLAFTVREAFAITILRSEANTVATCASLPSQYSIRTEVVDGISVPYSEDGPTGADGGLVELLTAYRTCSR